MTRRNTPLEVEQVEQLALIARLLPHHGESPSLISQADGITVRQFSRALFQQHRPKTDFAEPAAQTPRRLIRSPRRRGRAAKAGWLSSAPCDGPPPWGSQASALVSHAVRINPGHTTSGHPSRQCLASQRQPRRRTEGLSRTQVERCNPAFDRRDDVLRIRAEVEVKRHEHHDVA